MNSLDFIFLFFYQSSEWLDFLVTLTIHIPIEDVCKQNDGKDKETFFLEESCIAYRKEKKGDKVKKSLGHLGFFTLC